MGDDQSKSKRARKTASAVGGAAARRAKGLRVVTSEYSEEEYRMLHMASGYLGMSIRATVRDASVAFARDAIARMLREMNEKKSGE